jgi:hypothetical protein
VEGREIDRHDHSSGQPLQVFVAPASSAFMTQSVIKNLRVTERSAAIRRAERQVIAVIVLIRTRRCYLLLLPRVRSLTMRGRLDI